MTEELGVPLKKIIVKSQFQFFSLSKVASKIVQPQPNIHIKSWRAKRETLYTNKPQ